MLPVLLGVVGEGRRALGVEWDAAKVACGAHAARGHHGTPPLDGVAIVEGDARTADIPACDVNAGWVRSVSTPPSEGALIGSSVEAMNRFAALAPPVSS